MNTAFGPPEELPFDMGHLRYPIQYSIAADATNAERREARAKLSRTVEERLRLQITATPAVIPEKYLSDRIRLVREDLQRLKEPWQKPLLRELMVRGTMDEAHASGYLVRGGFPHMSGALNALEFHSNLVTHDLIGHYSIKPELFRALETAIDEQENPGNAECNTWRPLPLSSRK